MAASTISAKAASLAASRRSPSTAAPARAEPPLPRTRSGGTAGPAAVVDLKKTAASMIDRATVDRDAAAAATRSFDEQLQIRSKAFADRLSAAFSKEGIPLDHPIALRIEAGGIVTDSPYRKKIEKIFKDDPELTKELQNLASLKSMRAAQASLELFDDEKKRARSRDEQNQAYDRCTTRMIDIERLSGVMTLKDGALSSAAEDYMGVVSGAAPSSTRDRRAEVLARYSAILSAGA